MTINNTNKYFFKNDTDSITTDIFFNKVLFLNNQLEIYTKYQEDFSKRFPIDNEDLRVSFIKRIDVFILNVLEEVYETKNETKEYNLIKSIKELNDCIMYIGTLMIQMFDYLEHLKTHKSIYSNFIEDVAYGVSHLNIKNNKVNIGTESMFECSQNNLKSIHDRKNKNYQLLKEIDIALDDITTTLIKVRTLFPERKWHKEYPQLSNTEMTVIIIKAIKTLDQLVNILTAFLANNVKIKELNQVFINKAQFIKELDLVQE